MKETLLLAKLTTAVVFLGLSVITTSSHAELIEMSDASLDLVLGKKGLTIDIETEVTIAEFLYVDGGAMYWRDYSLSGIGGGLVDNIRATVDISDGTETLSTGFSDMAMLAVDMGLLDVNDTDVAWAISEYSNGLGEFGKQYQDGDLVIHVASQDYGLGVSRLLGPSNPADHIDNLALTKNAIDINIKQGDFGIRSSDGLVETSLTRNVSIELYLGYLDILITNRGNGMHDTGKDPGSLTGGLASAGKPSNILLSNSYIGIDAKFRVENMEIESTNNVTNLAVPLSVKNPYLTLKKFRIHNERGADTLGSFGYASVQSKLAAASGILNNMRGLTEYEVSPTTSQRYVDGQAIYDINIVWDWDIGHISYGDTGTSIGAVYFTDFHISDTSLVISAH